MTALRDWRAARWLPGGHLQTCFGPIFRHFTRPRTVRERWELPDGDFVDIDRLPGPAGAPMLLVLHGLEGSSRAPYVRGMLAQARRRGWRAAALNFRNCSDEPNRLLRSYHSGETSDLDAVVRRFASESNTDNRILIVGFSLGGNVLVKWLGEQGADARHLVRGAAAISVPFDLAVCAANIDGPGAMRFLYRERFLRTLKAKALMKARLFGGRLDPARVRAVRTLAAFDEEVTAKVHGFAGARDYWDRCSSGPFLSKVRVPLLLLSSLDDPIVPAACLPDAAALSNPAVTLEVAERGGHVGFVAGPPWAPRYFAEERATAFLEDALQR